MEPTATALPASLAAAPIDVPQFPPVIRDLHSFSDMDDPAGVWPALHLLPRYSVQFEVQREPSTGVTALRMAVTARLVNLSNEPQRRLVFNLPQYCAASVYGLNPIEIDANWYTPTLDAETGEIAVLLDEAVPPGDTTDIHFIWNEDYAGCSAALADSAIQFGPDAFALSLPADMVVFADDIQQPAAELPALFHVLFNNHAAATWVSAGMHRNEDDTGALSGTEVRWGPNYTWQAAYGPWQPEIRQIGDQQVQFWIQSKHAEDAAADLRLASDFLAYLQHQLGPPPAVTFQVVDFPGIPVDLAAPGLLLTHAFDSYSGEEGLLQGLAAARTAALWRPEQVAAAGWLFPALSGYLVLGYEDEAYGAGTSTGRLSHYRSWLFNDQLADMPLQSFSDGALTDRQMQLFTQYKGVLFLDVLQAQVGKQVLDEALIALYQQYPADMDPVQTLRDNLETGCTCSLADLFDLWVNEGGMFLGP